MPRASTKAASSARGRPSKSAKERGDKHAALASSSPEYRPANVSLQLQQKALNIFRDSLKPSDEDKALVQEVKGHLFDRNFEVAFGDPEYLRVYAARWSPSRALGYLQIFADLQDVLTKTESTTNEESERKLSVVAIGGGAGAELVALGAWLYSLSTSTSTRYRIEALLLDIARWDDVVASLTQSLIVPPQLSQYASAAAKEANVPLLSNEAIHISFAQQDVLALDEASIEAIGNATLVTLMFTLNELYTTSMPKTQQMLVRLTTAMNPGAHLLVVDSPGSYSTVTINGSEKAYPMHWLLDHTLLATPQKRGSEAEVIRPKWEKVLTDESRWFRMPQGLLYPIELENMRYQIHLYRRATDSDTDTIEG